MKKKFNTFNICLYLPFILYTLCNIYIYIESGGQLLIMSRTILIFVLLLLISVGLSSNKKWLKIIGLITMIIFLIVGIYMGYYDYNQWMSTVIFVQIFIYYLSIYLAKNKKIL